MTARDKTGRSAVLQARVTPEQGAQVGALAREKGLSLSDFLRQAALGAGAPLLDAEQRVMLGEAKRQLVGAARNLNQATAALHSAAKGGPDASLIAAATAISLKSDETLRVARRMIRLLSPAADDDAGSTRE
ncbi:MAG: hypothetical protein HQL42_16470 [Alphaproteobacteria bacterium]|nr:hypothetical protein [Alphaproteobacteria bacterium]